MGRMDIVTKNCDVKVTRGKTKERCAQAIPDGRSTEVTVGDIVYTLDLCPEHRTAFDTALNPFTSTAARVDQKVGSRVRQVLQGREGSFTTKKVREWALERGMDVPVSGRLPKKLFDEYNADIAKR